MKIIKKHHISYNCFKFKYYKLEEIYEKPYHIFFMFDLLKFIISKYYGEYRGIWGCEGTVYENYNPELKYPIIRVYKFYPWEEMAIGYCKAYNFIYDEVWCEVYKISIKERLLEGIKWCNLINKNQKLLLKILPDLVKETDLPFEEDYINEIKNDK